jgi:hypothetical protein
MWMHLCLSYSTHMYCMVVNATVKGCFVNKPSRRHLDWHEVARKSDSSTLMIEGPCLLVSICVSWSFMLPRVTWNYNDVLTYFLSLKISLSGGRFSSIVDARYEHLSTVSCQCEGALFLPYYACAWGCYRLCYLYLQLWKGLVTRV